MARPQTYSEFTTITSSEELSSAIVAAVESHTDGYFYLHPPTPPLYSNRYGAAYKIDNPIVIPENYSRSIFIHGGSTMGNSLYATNPNEPLFKIAGSDCQISFSRLSFRGIKPNGSVATNGDADPKNQVAVLVEGNIDPVWAEFLNCTVTESKMLFRGPGYFKFETCMLSARARVDSSIMVDHPEADVVVMGGNIGGGGYPRAAIESNPFGGKQYHVWQKRGRLRMYTTGHQSQAGTADVRIESGTYNGLPHALVDIRSEGPNTPENGGPYSRVPRYLEIDDRESYEDNPINVFLPAMQHAMSSMYLSREAHTVDIQSSKPGTLWILGANMGTVGRTIVSGNAPETNIVAIGCCLRNPDNILEVNAKHKISYGNYYEHHALTGDKGRPFQRRIPDDKEYTKFPPKGEVDHIPVVPVPEPAPRVLLTEKLPGMIDVTEAPYNAVGDGVVDDTVALQTALDDTYGHIDNRNQSPKVMYIPKGTYRITDALHFNTVAANTHHHFSGAWIAGNGSANTIIWRDPWQARNGECTTFITEGFNHSQIQGITFKTVPAPLNEDGIHDPRDVTVAANANFYFENRMGQGGASQECTFYDVVFDGGKYASGSGLGSPLPPAWKGPIANTTMLGAFHGNCSEVSWIKCKFMNAYQGAATGQFNALANLYWDVEFENNGVSFGLPATWSRGDPSANSWNWAQGPSPLAWSGGSFSVLNAKITGTTRHETWLHGGAQARSRYFAGITSNTAIMDVWWNSGAYYTGVWDQCTFNFPTPRTDLNPDPRSTSRIHASATNDHLNFHHGSSRGPIFLNSWVSPNFNYELRDAKKGQYARYGEESGPVFGEPQVLFLNPRRKKKKMKK